MGSYTTVKWNEFLVSATSQVNLLYLVNKTSPPPPKKRVYTVWIHL